MRRFTMCLAVCSVCSIVTSFSSGQAFTRVVTFGDSLSDVGNVASQTFGISPGSSYYNNRFSNGPLWIDSLSTSLSLGASVNSRGGGYNYATGGTRSGTGYVSPVFFVNLPNAGQQVTDYLAARTPGADELFTIWTSGNDFLDGQTDPTLPANNVQTLVTRLANAGVKNVAVFNLPPLGETPRYRSTADRATMNTRSAQFNAALATRLDTFSAANAGVNVFRVDIAGFFDQALANPAAYDITNTTDRALRTDGTVVSNPDAYLFYDDVHPTRAAHALIGSLALDAVTYRQFIGSGSAGSDWDVAANWAVPRVPDQTSIVAIDADGPRVDQTRTVRQLNLNAGGRLTIEAGTGAQLVMTQSATLAGEIGVDFAAGFVGLPGETLPLLSYAQSSCVPALVNLTGYAGLDFEPVVGATALGVELSATPGDANLDDAVNFDDLLTLAQNYGATSGRNWLNGDFTGNAGVDFDDLLLLAQQYGSGADWTMSASAELDDAFARDWTLARSMVPEPAAMSFLLIAAAGTSRRARA